MLNAQRGHFSGVLASANRQHTLKLVLGTYPCWGLHARPCQRVNRRQEENGTAQYYRRGGKGKGHLATCSTRAKISCVEELNKRCESMGVRWLLSYHTLSMKPYLIRLLPRSTRIPHAGGPAWYYLYTTACLMLGLYLMLGLDTCLIAKLTLQGHVYTVLNAFFSFSFFK